jgi:hypothetical protein
VLALLLAAVTAVSALPTEHAAAPAKVFDRTLVCTTGDGGPGIYGAPGPRADRTPGGVGVSRNFTGGSLPLVAAGTRDGAYIDKQHCKRSANRVPLTRKGLPGPPAGVGSVKCPVGRVLVRLRYTYVPGSHPPQSEVGGRLISAAIAVRSYRTLKPLAFADLTAHGGKLQLFSAASCTRA